MFVIVNQKIIVDKLYLSLSRFLKAKMFISLINPADIFREADEAMIKKHCAPQSAWPFE